MFLAAASQEQPHRRESLGVWHAGFRTANLKPPREVLRRSTSCMLLWVELHGSALRRAVPFVEGHVRIRRERSSTVRLIARRWHLEEEHVSPQAKRSCPDLDGARNGAMPLMGIAVPVREHRVAPLDPGHQSVMQPPQWLHGARPFGLRCHAFRFSPKTSARVVKGRASFYPRTAMGKAIRQQHLHFAPGVRQFPNGSAASQHFVIGVGNDDEYLIGRFPRCDQHSVGAVTFRVAFVSR